MKTAKQSHNLSVGIVGLPNSGKSTLFNSLTQCSVPAENYPFCTIDKNVGVVELPDERLDSLAKHYEAKEIVPAAMKFIDIAGLVEGASKGEGLGNKFLSHIREVDVILFVLRSFIGDTVSHVCGRIDPLNDLQILETELLLKDIETVEKKIDNIKSEARVNEEVAKEKEFLEDLLQHLYDDKFAITLRPESKEEIQWLHDLFLLTNKERMYLLNIKEGTISEEVDKWTNTFKDYIEEDEFILEGDVKLIGDLLVADKGEKKEYFDLLECAPEEVIMFEDILNLAKERLDLITFYTGNEKECNAWCIEKNSTAKEAAGVIHSDLGKNFITADVVNVKEMIESGGWQKSKEAGIVKKVSKEYIVEDGDYMVVYSNS